MVISGHWPNSVTEPCYHLSGLVFVQKGQTPIDLAVENMYSPVASLLRAAPANPSRSAIKQPHNNSPDNWFAQAIATMLPHNKRSEGASAPPMPRGADAGPVAYPSLYEVGKEAATANENQQVQDRM